MPRSSPLAWKSDTATECWSRSGNTPKCCWQHLARKPSYGIATPTTSPGWDGLSVGRLMTMSSRFSSGLPLRRTTTSALSPGRSVLETVDKPWPWRPGSGDAGPFKDRLTCMSPGSPRSSKSTTRHQHSNRRYSSFTLAPTCAEAGESSGLRPSAMNGSQPPQCVDARIDHRVSSRSLRHAPVRLTRRSLNYEPFPRPVHQHRGRRPRREAVEGPHSGAASASARRFRLCRIVRPVFLAVLAAKMPITFPRGP